MVNVVEFSQMVAILDRAASPALVDRALSAADLDRRIFEQTTGYLPYRLEAVVLEHVARALGDDHLGARLSGEFDYAAYAAYARYVLGAPDLATALKRGRRAFPLISPGSAIVLRKSGEHLLIGRQTGLDAVIGRKHLEDAALFIIMRVVRHFLGAQWRPSWIEIPGQEPDRRAFLEDAVGAPVQMGRAMPALAVGLHDLSARNPTPLEAKDALAFAELPVLMGVSPPRTFQDAVREMLRAQLAFGDLSEGSVAHRLAMGGRTLQRALKHEGTTFREVKARFLEDRARALLAGTDLTIDAVSQHLGYAEPNSFRRAFRNRFGLSPSEFRARGRG